MRRHRRKRQLRLAQRRRRKRVINPRQAEKWVALIALALGVLALPFLLYSLSQPILSEFAFATRR